MANAIYHQILVVLFPEENSLVVAKEDVETKVVAETTEVEGEKEIDK
jgi:hypothetical protein